MSALRVRFAPEDDPTFPGEWGWDAEETAEYMRLIENGELVAVLALCERECDMGGWHVVGSLGDIHVKNADLIGELVTPEELPTEPDGSYLYDVARELFREATADA